MLTIITYADERFQEERNLFARLHKGVAESLVNYGPQDIPEPYLSFYRHLLSLPAPAEDRDWYMARAARTAYWFWKPVMIYLTLLQLPENDLLIYCDARSRIKRYSIGQEIEAIFSENERGPAPRLPFIVSQNAWPLELVCLPVMFKLMGLEDLKYRRALQWSAHALLMKNTAAVRLLVRQWITNMMLGNGQILTDDSLPHPAGNYQHSCSDQSILNLTLLKENIQPIHCEDLVLWYGNVTDKFAGPEGLPRSSDQKYASALFYGSSDSNYVDIMPVVIERCGQNRSWLIPATDSERDVLFGDPCMFVRKHVLIRDCDSGQHKIYDYESVRFSPNKEIIGDTVPPLAFDTMSASGTTAESIDAEAVVVSFRDTLDFLNDVFRHCPFLRFQLYDKSQSRPALLPFNGFQVAVKQLPNVGMDIYGFVRHIIERYDSLSDITFFVTGGADSVDYKAEKLQYVLRNWKSCLESGYVEMQRMEFVDENFTLDYWGTTNPLNRPFNQGGNLKPARIRPFGAWYQKYIGPLSIIEESGTSYNNIFAVRKERILQHDLRLYRELSDQLEEGGMNSEVAHYIERIWRSLFSIDWASRSDRYLALRDLA
jgi:hypothetical protein